MEWRGPAFPRFLRGRVSISSRRQYNKHLLLAARRVPHMLSAPETRRHRLRRPPEGTGRPRSVLRLRPDNSSQRRSWFTFRKRLSTHAFRWYGSERRRRVIAFVMMFVRGNCRLLTVVVADLRARLLVYRAPPSFRYPHQDVRRSHLSLSHLSPPPICHTSFCQANHHLICVFSCRVWLLRWSLSNIFF